MHRFPIEVCERGALEIHDLVDEQLNYYRARAPEYDQWFLRQGRYDRGSEHRAEWFREIAEVEQALEPAIEGKSILELACGTGLWTQRLAARASSVHAVDAAPEMLSLNRERLQTKNVHYVNANIFSNRNQIRLRYTRQSSKFSPTPPREHSSRHTMKAGTSTSVLSLQSTVSIPIFSYNIYS